MRKGQLLVNARATPRHTTLRGATRGRDAGFGFITGVIIGSLDCALGRRLPFRRHVKGKMCLMITPDEPKETLLILAPLDNGAHCGRADAGERWQLTYINTVGGVLMV